VTPSRALTLAPEPAVLAARPTSPVAHVHVGPLTRSRRFIPRAARPVCGMRTRRLHVLTETPFMVAATRRLCVRCSDHLSARVHTGDQCAAPQRERGPGHPTPAVPAPAGVGPHTTDELVSRDDYAAAYADLTPVDIALGAWVAETVEEVEHLELLALLLVGYPDCARRTIRSDRPHRDGLTVDQHIARARGEVGARHAPRISPEEWAEKARRARDIADQERTIARERHDREVAVFGHSGARAREKARFREGAIFIDARTASADTG
jgi:hypothetical protein